MSGLTQDRRIGQSLILSTDGLPDIDVTLIRWGDTGRRLGVTTQQQLEQVSTFNRQDHSQVITLKRTGHCDIKLTLLRSRRSNKYGTINIQADDSVTISRSEDVRRSVESRIREVS